EPLRALPRRARRQRGEPRLPGHRRRAVPGAQPLRLPGVDEEFDEIFARIRERRLEYFADPRGEQPGAINHHYGGRGVYWPDPDGHWLEILTVPYGGWDGQTPA